MKRALSCLLFSILIAATPAAAQEDLPVEIGVEYATFAYSEDASLLEVYLSFNPTSLVFERKGNLFEARLPLRLRLTQARPQDAVDEARAVVWDEPLELHFALDDTTGLRPGQRFVHAVRKDIAPGTYRLTVGVAEDSTAQRTRAMEVRQRVLVADYASVETPKLSGVLLASSIQQNAAEDDPFYRHGLAVRPNVNAVYGVDLEQMYYYVEVYGAETIRDGEGEYDLLAYVSEGTGQEALAGLKKRLNREVRSPDIVLGSFDVSSLPTGSYFLRLAVLDADGSTLLENAKKFVVFNPDVQPAARVDTDESFTASLYANMTEEEVDRELSMVRFIATSGEQRRIRQIRPLEGKQRFLMTFWSKRDSQPLTDVNENRQEFLNMIEYVNAQYGTQIREGWETDRGEALLKYGRPIEIERHLAGNDTAPYVIWHYDNIPSVGQAIFIFADLEGFGEYELLHSTVPGERTMPNWQQYVSGY